MTPLHRRRAQPAPFSRDVHNVEQSEKLADVVVNVPVAAFPAAITPRPMGLIKVGYQAAEQIAAACCAMPSMPNAWKAYLAARESRRLPHPRPPPPGSHRWRRSREPSPNSAHNISEGQPSPASTENASSLSIQTRESQLHGRPSPPTHPPPSAAAARPDNGVLVRLSHDPSVRPICYRSRLWPPHLHITRGEMTLRPRR